MRVGRLETVGYPAQDILPRATAAVDLGAVALGVARDAERASSRDAKSREAALALVRAGLELLADDVVDPEALKRALDARRALAGAPLHGRSYEYRRIAFVLERGAAAMLRASGRAQELLMAEGRSSEVAVQLASIVAVRAVLPPVARALEVIDERLLACGRVDPLDAVLRRLAGGRVVIDGAVADLLLDTSALDTTHDPAERRSEARARLQQAVSAALGRERGR